MAPMEIDNNNTILCHSEQSPSPSSSSWQNTVTEEGMTKKPVSMSRLQKRAPPSLQLAPRTSDGVTGWEDVDARTPIPLLSPLLLSPAPWIEENNDDDGDQLKQKEPNENIVNAEAAKSPGGWCHPALTMTPSSETASKLLPLFQYQCALAHTTQASPPTASSSFLV